jgi:hypothetical protein
VVSRISSKALLAFSLLGIFANLQAQSAELETAVSACETNPNCSHEVPNAAGSILFKIKQSENNTSVLCQKTGECMMVLPRGKKYVVSDVVALIKAQ